MKKFLEGIKYWGQLLLLPIYWFSFLFPRNKNIWLFGSTFGRRFADNPRYFYLYVSQMVKQLDREDGIEQSGNRGTDNENYVENPYIINGKAIRPIWISHNKELVEFLNEEGYEAYYYHSLKGIWYCLRGKVYCFDNYSKDISFWLSGGALKFNMWHGVGNKCINYDNKHDKVRHPKNAWEKFKYFPRRLSDEKSSHYILSTSPMMSEIFARAFQVSEEHVIEAGYPRNDILFGNMLGTYRVYLPEEQNLMQSIEEWKQHNRILLGYLPTFRQSERKFFDVCDLSRFNTFLKEQNMVLICKLHPKSACKEAFEVMKYSNIYVVPAEVDVNSFLGRIDLLIADYSSVYSDYMLLERPVVAFHYDYEEYSTDTRDAYFDFEEYMPEVRAYKLEELENAILQVRQKDVAMEKRRAFRKKLYKDADGKSAKRLVKAIIDILEAD